MRLIVIHEGAMIADVVCGEEAVYIGSQEGSRIHLSDARVATRQAVVYPAARGQWSLEQLAPECEIFVNAMTVPEKAALKTGDEIRIVDYSIRVYPEYENHGTSRVEVGTSRAQLERFVASRLPAGTAVRKGNEALTIQAEQIARISNANLSVSRCVLVEELMDIALQNLLSAFAAQRAWMGVRRVNYGPMEYVEGRLLTGQPTDLPEIASALKPRVLDRGQFLMVPVASADVQTSILTGPLLGPDGTLGMIYIDTGDTNRCFTTQDIDFFIVLLNVFAVQLDAIFKQIARNRAAMVAGEVAVAHEIQARLTPRKLPQWPQLQFGAFREPGRENTGDIYDVAKLGNGMAAIMVACTPATGVMPSMLIAQAQAAFRMAAMHQDPPHVFLRSLNWLLYDGEKDHPLNCFAGIIDPSSGEIRYALAGDFGAYIISNRGDERRLGPEQPSAPLGLFKSTVYPLLPEQLTTAETLVLFTPGVTTAKNNAGETFGEDRFVNILCDGFGQLASSMLKEMLTDLRSYTEGGMQPDDITVLMAHHVDKL
ncbi:MAG: SpoIIE family protein phosphatase [Planctomycetota bacterium]